MFCCHDRISVHWFELHALLVNVSFSFSNLHDTGTEKVQRGDLVSEFGMPIRASTIISSECEHDCMRAIFSGPMPAPIPPPPSFASGSGSMRRRHAVPSQPHQNNCCPVSSASGDSPMIINPPSTDTTTSTITYTSSIAKFKSHNHIATTPTVPRRSSLPFLKWVGPSIEEDERETPLGAHASDAGDALSPRQFGGGDTVSPGVESAGYSPVPSTEVHLHSNEAYRALQRTDDRTNTFQMPPAPAKPTQHNNAAITQPVVATNNKNADSDQSQTSQTRGQRSTRDVKLSVRWQGFGWIRFDGELELKTLVKNRHRKTFAKWHLYWTALTAAGQLQFFAPKSNFFNPFKRITTRSSVQTQSSLDDNTLQIRV